MVENHPNIAHGSVGVLLINLGTPESPTRGAVRLYLRQFLSDGRVIEIPPIIWRIILYLFILPFRPGKSAALYRKIWDREHDCSPLKTITRQQGERLQERFADRDIIVDWAMRYGKPSIEDSIKKLQERGCSRIVICPLYPQYASATTGSAQEAVFDTLKKLRWQPSLRFLPPYYDDNKYIESICQSILRHTDFKKEKQTLLMSFHGLPYRTLQLGDPYYCHCHKTFRLVRESLGLSEERCFLGFQSRFGKARWLEPYADELVRQLAEKGTNNLWVVCAGFSADCLETLEEVNMGLRETFLSNGGKEFRYISCLNADDLGIDMLSELIERELAGWVDNV